MDSCIHYYSDHSPVLQYRPRELFLDNGAFSASMNGNSLNPQRIMSIQESLMPSLTIPLDYPFGRHTFSQPQMARRWKKTTDNIVYWQNSSGLSGRLVPTLHAWSKASLESNVKWLSKHADATIIALGSLVDGENFSPETRGYFGDREPKLRTIDMIVNAIEATTTNTDFKIHLMGFGSSPLMLHLAYYLGVDSTDSSGHRRKAAYGKIVLQSTGERYLGAKIGVFGHGMELTNRRSSDVAELDRCNCEICLTNKDILWHDWRARAIHNEHVMKVESANAMLLKGLGEGAHSAYLESIFRKSSLARIWKYARRKRQQLLHNGFGRQ